MEPDFTIPVSVIEVDESIAGWPFRKPVDDADDYEPDCYDDEFVADNHQMSEDERLDDPRHTPYLNLRR